MMDEMDTFPALAARILVAAALAWLILGCGGKAVGSAAAGASDASSPPGDSPVVEPPGDATEDAAPDGESADDTDPGDAGPTLPPRVCNPGTTWTPGTPAFTDVTAQSGLSELGVAGIRLSGADIDGDGDLDLAIRTHHSFERDDFGPDGKRWTWLLRNNGDLTFDDVTQSSGFTVGRDGGEGRTTQIVVWGDVDNDGDLDAFSGVNASDVAKDNGDRTELLLNDGAGHFVLAPGGGVREADRNWGTAGASFADLDLDGALDLWVAYDTFADSVLQDRIYLGDGAGSATDATDLLGLTTQEWLSLPDLNAGLAHHRSWGATVCDLNDDGWPDLLTSSYGRYFNAFWQSDGQGGYTNRAADSYVGADQRTDWTTNYNAQCYCKLVPTAADCAGVPDPPNFFPCSDPNKLRWNHQYDREPFRLGGNTFSTVCGDVDNDGDMDLMHFEIVHWDVGDTSDPSELLLNDGGASPVFLRPGPEATGIVRDWKEVAWNAGDITGAFLDFDNDGRQDVFIGSSDYPGTRAFLFHQKPDGTFEEVLPTDGIDHPRSLGVVVADLDRDGDLDVVAGHGTARCESDPACYPTQEVHVFRNEMGTGSNWLEVKLVGGPGTNRAAIGARVSVTAGGVTQTQEVGGGYGHYGLQHGTVLHFGLGAACDVDTVTVRWPNAKLESETHEGLRANYRVTITQSGSVVYE